VPVTARLPDEFFGRCEVLSVLLEQILERLVPDLGIDALPLHFCEVEAACEILVRDATEGRIEPLHLIGKKKTSRATPDILSTDGITAPGEEVERRVSAPDAAGESEMKTVPALLQRYAATFLAQ
jgi:hypothetical protein